MEKLNKEYPDEQYKKDLDINLKEEKAKFIAEMLKIYRILLLKKKLYLLLFVNLLLLILKEMNN